MLLSPDEVEHFYKLHRSLMCYVNQQLQVAPGVDTVDEFLQLSPEIRYDVRQAYLEHPEFLESFLKVNPHELSDDELDTVRSWRHQVAGKFLIFRYLKQHTIFLSTEKPPVAYGVMALTDPIKYLVGPYLPLLAETVLLPFRGKIVFDGILSSYNISFGSGIKSGLNADYKQAKERLGIVTSLPVSAHTLPSNKPKRTPERKSPKWADDVKETVEVIVGMTDQFCEKHLNEEYAALCRTLTEKLARKRPSPLLRGKPTTWACGIIRTIGWVNYLDDPTTKPHMKLTAIDKEFGVAESTGQGKSKTIRTMLKIRTFDPQWTVPSRIDELPRFWSL